MADRRTLTLGMAAILIASLLAGAGSLAYFSDIKTSTGNTFIAGMFGLELVPNGDTLPFIATNIEPGWDRVEEHGVRNIGTLDGEVCITAENFVEPGDDYPELPEPNPDMEMSAEAFAKILYMRIYVDTDQDTLYEDDEEIYDGPVYGMVTDSFNIKAGETIRCKFLAYLLTDLDDPSTPENEDDNLYQADGVACDIVFHGTTEITIVG